MERRHIGEIGLWEVKLGVLNEFMVVPKHTNTGPLPRSVQVFQLASHTRTQMKMLC